MDESIETPYAVQVKTGSGGWVGARPAVFAGEPVIALEAKDHRNSIRSAVYLTGPQCGQLGAWLAEQDSE
jgi:hypothetical protein